MVNSCCVRDCKNKGNTGDKVAKFRFPTINKRLLEQDKKLLEKRRNAWRAALRNGTKEEDLGNKRICGSHFITGKPAHFRDIQNPDWIPNQNMGYKSKTNGKLSLARYHRAKTRVERKASQTQSINEQNMSIDVQPPAPLPEIEIETGIGIQTDVTYEYLTSLEQELQKRNEYATSLKQELQKRNEYATSLEQELQNRNEEVYALRQQVSELSYNEAFFQGKDGAKKMKYFTGLPNLETFKLILSRVDSAIAALQVKKMSTFQKLLLTLMKLRHNTTFCGLGYKFRIHTNQASYIFSHVVVILEYSLRYMVHWPDREALKSPILQRYNEKYGHVIAVDCFEIDIEKPSNQKTKNEIFSNYKHNYPGKYLIGITPHGFISYISNGWGGHVSDKVLTEESELVENLVPGDVVLANRGFAISESVSLKHAELNIPAFIRGVSQMDPRDAESSRDVATVRIHIERFIAALRNKYRILKGPIPMTILRSQHKGKNLLDYIVRVCCIFVNMCKPMVPLD